MSKIKTFKKEPLTAEREFNEWSKGKLIDHISSVDSGKNYTLTVTYDDNNSLTSMLTYQTKIKIFNCEPNYLEKEFNDWVLSEKKGISEISTCDSGKNYILTVLYSVSNALNS